MKVILTHEQADMDALASQLGAWLLWPDAGVTVSLLHAGAMVVAGLGWGIYSMAGRKAGDPLVSSMANIVLAAPAGLLFAAALPSEGVGLSPDGVALAVVSGAVASGLGYALWYTILPALDATIAAVAQLTVPVLAMLGGALILGEYPELAALGAGAIVLGGVAISVLRR